MNNVKNPSMFCFHWLVYGVGIGILFSLISCTPSPTPAGGVTPVPVAMQATDAKGADAMATIYAVLTQSALNTRTVGQTPDMTATAQAAINATLTAAPPTATPIPVPTLDTLATSIAATSQAAIAATLTALAPTPTTTPTATPNQDDAATEQAAIAATLTALAPTITSTPTPNLDATQAEEAKQMDEAVNATLTAMAALFTPTPQPTDTPMPPTDTPLPPPPPTNIRAPRPPTNTPRPRQPTGLFHGNVNPICNGDRNMTWFEGTVYVNGQPANGYKVVFKSYLVPGDQPATAPAISGPHEGYTDWANGYYSHIVNDHFEKKHLEVWIINDAGQALSDRVRWNSDGTEGSCNKAVINFSQ